MLPHAEYLNRAGFNIILYDLRGHGDSDPVELTSLNRMLRDFDKIMEYWL
ncbi:alpha/beta hydrolase, partial [candidate division KSB1 bacterium]|nr:alpha/beta hydrolase [candidate division KSB1 bacterium]